MGIGRSIVASRAPSSRALERLESLARDPFAKNADFAAAVDACLGASAMWHAHAASHIGRAGYLILARLLEVHAGAAPKSAGEDPSRETSVTDAARRFCAHLTVGEDMAHADIPHLVDELLSIDAVDEVFRERYELPEALNLADCHLHRTGTTSAIFRCRWSGGIDVALKVTLARYFDVDALSRASETYGERFRAPSEIGPRVHQSGRRFIVLDFVEGQTLEEHLVSLAAADPESRTVQARVADAFAVMLALTSGLDRLARAGRSLQARHHLDLTPNNVIIPTSDGGLSKLKFIDFGRNQLLVEPIAASSAAIAKAARYVAPEIRDGTLAESDEAYSAADVYSAGLLALETFAPGGSQSLNEKLDELWQWGAGLAAILEDVLVDDASKRLHVIPPADRKFPFAHLVDCLENEIKVQQEFAAELAPVGVVGNALRLIGRPHQIVRMYRVSTQFADHQNAYRRYRELALWNALAMACWLVIWVTVLGLVMYRAGTALHLSWIAARGQQLGEALLQDFRAERFPQDLWGRIIAFSFGLMAFTYYTNIYATVAFARSSAGRLRGRARTANAMARSLAFVTPAPCIAGAVIDPSIWPWATIFGVCWASASNWSMASLHHAVWLETKSAVGQDTDPTGNTRHVFNEWALQMSIYAGIVAILAVTLHFLDKSRSFPVNNVGAYVTGLTFLNLFFIVRLNCIKQAPLMRGFLHRTAFNLRRLSSFD